ncbi:MAG: MATE family efflux transporter [Phycisphaerae bacterium]|nr:MATE family efflux transporter [Phycisphaerae bacterium]
MSFELPVWSFAIAVLKKKLDLSPENLNRTIWILAIPAVLENLLQVMVFISDTMIVGWLKEANPLAAASLIGPVLFLSNAPFYAMAIGAGSLVSRFWGQGDHKKAQEYGGTCMGIAVLLSIAIFAIVLPFTQAVVNFFDCTEAVSIAANKYLRIVLLSNILGLPMLVANGIIRAVGKSTTAMIVTLIMNICNVVVSITLAFGLGIVEPMGFLGVAWGTVIARSLGGVLAILVIIVPKMGIAITLQSWFDFHWETIKRAWNTIFPAFMERFLYSIGNMFFIKIVAALGTSVIAGHQIALHIESIAFMPAWGVAMAVSAITGQAIGAGKSPMAIATVKKTITWTGLAMVIIGFSFILFSYPIVSLFGATEEVRNQAAMALQVGALELPFLAFSLILVSALRGAGDTRSPLVVCFVCIILFRLGAVYLFAIVLNLGIAGVWLATSMDWLGRSLGLLWFFKRGAWQHIHAREEEAIKKR